VAVFREHGNELTKKLKGKEYSIKNETLKERRNTAAKKQTKRERSER
jgi:hypothetical protein